MKILALIPARGGSKGIPKKNIKPLNGKPLIGYTIEFVKSLFEPDDICLSTDDQEIIGVAKEFKIDVPFTRPQELAGDKAGTYEVVMHAIEYYETQGRNYDVVALFQPTSPFRLKKHFSEALQLLTDDTDLVISVVRAKANPYYVLVEENQNGFLTKSKSGNFNTRQELPEVYEINGSIYLYRVESLKVHHSVSFERARKYMMDDIYSVDIDDMTDWRYAEFLLEKELIEFNK